MRIHALLALVFLLLTAQPVAADAVMVTRAMKATTIMEAFVEDGSIRIELEVGDEDGDAFGSFLETTGEPPAAIPADAGLRVIADGQTLEGVLVQRVRRKRIERDEISGQPLPKPSDESVTFLVLEYPLRKKPKTLMVEPPVNEDGYAASDVGFVIYHQGVAINDFRYLPPGEMLRLDWEDPFYSVFDRRVMNRKYASPLNVFLYVEPFEVRKEMVVRPVDIARFSDISVLPHSTIPPDERQALLDELAAFLKTRAPVTIDGETPEPILERIHFLERGLRMTQVIPPGEPVDTTSAIVGAIFVYPVEGMPKDVRLTWDLFDERVKQVPASATDEAGPMPSFLTPDDPELHWVNFLKGSTLPSDLEVAGLQSRIAIPIVFVAASVLALGLLLLAFRRKRWPLAVLALAIVVAAWGVRPLGTIEVAVPAKLRTPSPEDAAPVIHALLHNAYRALDFRDEEVVFDRLAQSLSGEILERVYLEMRRGLRLENQGGARVRVRDVSLSGLSAEEATAPGTLRYQARWTVTGTVGHWGHTHMRTNAYEALVTLAQFDARWKIAELEILDEERVVQAQP